MADVKISNLPPYGVGVNPGPNDLLAIVDIATNTTRRVPLSNLTPSPVTPFSASLTAAYTTSSLPFYNSSQQVTATRTLTIVSGSATTIAGTISDGTTTVNVTTAGTATTVALNNTGLTIGGSATGTGSSGSSTTINFSGTVPAVAIYTPAFYAGASTGNTPPTFTTASSQTAGSQVGATITYTVATASTQYVWLATTRPITSVRQITTFGPAVVTADVTTTQNIGGTSFNVFGFTLLSTTTAVQLTIIN